MTPCAARLLTAGVAAVLLGACQRLPASEDFDVTATFPHDPAAFTQGLVFAHGVLFESTGRYGHSEVRRVELATGRVLARHQLPPTHFGEGLTLHRGRLYQLTWQEHVAYVYDSASLALLDSLPLPGEGWGLTSDSAHLFLSDGSDSLRVLEPATLRVVRVVRVRYQGAPLRQLNELEYHAGSILANVYETTWVAVIDPATGEVSRMLDFADLYPDRAPGAQVMNGIAVAPGGEELLLTGKFWPTLFRVRLRPRTVR